MRKSTEYVGVVTGDVVSSTSAKDPGLVQETLARVLDHVSEANRSCIVQDFAVYRGDGFQGVTTPESALRVVLTIRMNLLAEFRNWGGKRLDVRMGVGVGRTDPLGENPGQGHGEAFLLSGKTLDALSAKSTEKRRLVVRTPWEPFNRAMAPQCALFDALASGWTDRQSRAAELGLGGLTQKRIGERMGIKQSTASAHLTASGLWAVKESIAYYEESIRSLVAGGELSHE
jgi:hypothetical protein